MVVKGACVAGALIIIGQAAPPASILGTWHGSSICVDKARDQACHDEEVIYQVDSAAGATVRMSADKVVNGVREPMGVLRLTYDTATHAWSYDIRGRSNARWSFTPHGDQMSGTLVELPSGRGIRAVTVRRVP